MHKFSSNLGKQNSSHIRVWPIIIYFRMFVTDEMRNSQLPGGGNT